MYGREHEMAGHRGCHRDFGGLVITDLADHHDVWVLSQHGPQRVCETQSGPPINLDLVRARQSILDWILQGHNVLSL